MKNKKQLLKNNDINIKDCGTVDTQQTLIRIKTSLLSTHLKKNKKDIPAKRAIAKLTVQRKRLNRYKVKSNS